MASDKLMDMAAPRPPRSGTRRANVATWTTAVIIKMRLNVFCSPNGINVKVPKIVLIDVKKKTGDISCRMIIESWNFGPKNAKMMNLESTTIMVMHINEMGNSHFNIVLIAMIVPSFAEAADAFNRGKIAV